MLFWVSMLLDKRSSYSPIKPNFCDKIWTRHFFFFFFLDNLFLVWPLPQLWKRHTCYCYKKKKIENVVNIVLTSTCLTGFPTRQHCWLALKRSQCCCVSLCCVGFDPITEPTQPAHLGWVCQLNHWVTEAQPLSGRPLPAVELSKPSNQGQPAGHGSPVCDCAGEWTRANSGNCVVVYILSFQ
jgi:hypothetical protein